MKIWLLFESLTEPKHNRTFEIDEDNMPILLLDLDKCVGMKLVSVEVVT